MEGGYWIKLGQACDRMTPNIQEYRADFKIYCQILCLRILDHAAI